MKLGLRVGKLNQPECMIAAILFMPFLFGTLFELIGLPTALKYILDVMWILLSVLIVINFAKSVFAPSKQMWMIFAWCFGFFLFAAVTYFFHYQSLFYLAWGIRNNFRFYVFFAAAAIFLNRNMAKNCLKIFDVLFWICFAVCLVQFFLLGKNQDHLGGVFGVELGCNCYINIFFVIVIIKSAVYYLNKKERFVMFLLKSAAAISVAAMAELKFFFVEYAVILLMAILLSGLSARKLIVAVLGTVGVFVGVHITFVLFPEFANIDSIDNILKMLTEGGYGFDEALNRFTTIPVISSKFLTTAFLKLFGLGLGNCDTASYDFINTPFYEQNSFLRYNWFSTAFTYLETGAIGLLFTVGFFVLVFCFALHFNRRSAHGTDEKLFSQIAAIAATVCVLIFVYDCSLRTEACYIMYFVLALPFIEKIRSNPIL